MLEMQFPLLFSKNISKLHIPTIFKRNNVLAFFMHAQNIVQFSRACLHYDVIVMPYEDGWYFFFFLV